MTRTADAPIDVSSLLPPSYAQAGARPGQGRVDLFVSWEWASPILLVHSIPLND